MQIRAEATRRQILDTALGLFDTVGYANTSLADLMLSSGVSKGAFYYHFDNREAVARTIIGEADDKLQATCREILSVPSQRALEGLLRAILTIAEMDRGDRLIRVGVQLRGGLGQISSALEGFTIHRELFTDVVGAAITEGDLPADVDVDRMSHLLWTVVLGNHQHCGGTGEDLTQRLADVLTIILPAICTPRAATDYVALVNSLAGERTLLRR